MNRNIFVGLIVGLSVGFSYSLLLGDKPALCQQHLPIEADSIAIDTVDVIEEDGIRWYTLDTVWHMSDTVEYESIDTTVIYWPWGREEFYYFKYKQN